ncbi:Cruciform cutting endonuclease 1, mitochondrial [Fulvia fulva]|uniref:Cruciform cutting endonuclease 1, mitochondrial n=1 Tax=Passalora fulva TaxID=5499 RepID=A0A9Q8UVN5_PASFU|nr:Cruciform cutting endonuclease 1, mitochondrial [Fulvia fulva]UJO24158.1 Cruciform cutting endonuclease 1, mitochondrial [Fulvia fulva]WPV22010.1 Cruciform cutting endonuclease 1, mitochondrial [Fulvia fulva]WPV36876.1 Cruciform cutting endonuclease 1, mitochondrial [Fulvia fulva]
MAILRQPSLKGWQLRYWAYLTGLPTTGTKAELQSSLTATVPQQRQGNTPRRLVSLDMGIRNLAYCVIEPRMPKEKPNQISLVVHSWKRMDLLETAADNFTEDIAVETSQERSIKRVKAKLAAPVTKDSFTPAVLSKTAYRVTKDLLSHEPDTLLIERQRFRSGGAAAIQEWTVRVNMLESMLWASLETLRQEGKMTDAFPTVLAVSPARVAQFWSSAASMSLKPPTLFDEDNGNVQTMITHAMSDRRKIDKKDKVDIVRSWVAGTSDLDLRFEGEAIKIAEAFRLDPRQSKDAVAMAGGKLDDLADCLLQAVTWLIWEENRAVLNKLWQKTVDEIKPSDLSEHNAQTAVHPFSPEWIATRIAFPGMTEKQTADYLK